MPKVKWFIDVDEKHPCRTMKSYLIPFDDNSSDKKRNYRVGAGKGNEATTLGNVLCTTQMPQFYRVEVLIPPALEAVDTYRVYTSTDHSCLERINLSTDKALYQKTGYIQ